MAPSHYLSIQPLRREKGSLAQVQTCNVQRSGESCRSKSDRLPQPNHARTRRRGSCLSTSKDSQPRPYLSTGHTSQLPGCGILQRGHGHFSSSRAITTSPPPAALALRWRWSPELCRDGDLPRVEDSCSCVGCCLSWRWASARVGLVDRFDGLCLPQVTLRRTGGSIMICSSLEGGGSSESV